MVVSESEGKSRLAKKIRVGVIFGGRSGEHEVSIRSALSVIEKIDSQKYEVVPVAIGKDGRWLSPSEAAALLPFDTSQKLPPSVTQSRPEEIALIGDPSYKGLVNLSRDNSSAESLDVVFPVLHGTYGEDGTIQGLFEMAGIPYVGCGVLASACGMDKVLMKSLFRDAGLPICKYTWFLREHWDKDRTKVLRKVSKDIGFPCFVKPANLGSSVGISKADNRSGLIESINLAARYDRKIIVEEAVDAREIECAVLGNEEVETSLPGEYVILEKSAAFLDYTEKYSSTGNVKFIVPAKISKALIKRIQKLAVRAFQAVDGSGLARVDFFLRHDNGELLVNELNTLPGLTDVSGYPQMWEASGLPFPQVIDRLIELAFERHREKSRNETTRE